MEKQSVSHSATLTNSPPERNPGPAVPLLKKYTPPLETEQKKDDDSNAPSSRRFRPEKRHLTMQYTYLDTAN